MPVRPWRYSLREILRKWGECSSRKSFLAICWYFGQCLFLLLEAYGLVLSVGSPSLSAWDLPHHTDNAQHSIQRAQSLSPSLSTTLLGDLPGPLGPLGPLDVPGPSEFAEHGGARTTPAVLPARPQMRAAFFGTIRWIRSLCRSPGSERLVGVGCAEVGAWAWWALTPKE